MKIQEAFEDITKGVIMFSINNYYISFAMFYLLT